VLRNEAEYTGPLAFLMSFFQDRGLVQRAIPLKSHLPQLLFNLCQGWLFYLYILITVYFVLTFLRQMTLSGRPSGE
jgi:hypothetical protein